MNIDLLLSKAKRINDDTWVIGFTVVGFGYAYIIKVTGDNGKGTDCEYHAVDPETICRCTGKKDSEGKLVFGGDWFVDFEGREQGLATVISWNDDTCEFEGRLTIIEEWEKGQEPVIDFGNVVETLNIDEWNLADERIQGNEYDKSSNGSSD